MDAPDLSQVTTPDAPDLSGPVLSSAPDLSQEPVQMSAAPDLSNPNYSNEGRQPMVGPSFESQLANMDPANEFGKGYVENVAGPIAAAIPQAISDPGNVIPGAIGAAVSGLSTLGSQLYQQTFGAPEQVLAGADMSPSKTFERAQEFGQKAGETVLPGYKKIMESPGGQAGAILSPGPAAPLFQTIQWISKENPNLGALLYEAAGVGMLGAVGKARGALEGEVLPPQAAPVEGGPPRLTGPKPEPKGQTIEGEFTREPNDIVPPELSRIPQDPSNVSVPPTDARSTAISQVIDDGARSANTGIEVNEGGINPRTLNKDWIDNLTTQAKAENWPAQKLADTILDHYGGTFALDAVAKAKAIGSGQSIESTADRVTIMTHDQASGMMNPLNLAQETNWADTYKTIHQAVQSGRGLTTFPEMSFDKNPNGTWQMQGDVKNPAFDGRHRIDYLSQTGQHGIPVIIHDMTHGDLNRENPEFVYDASGKKVRMPANLYPEQPKAIDPETINPAAPRPDLSAMLTTKEEKAYQLGKELFGGLGNLSVPEFGAVYNLSGFNEDVASRIGLGTGSFRVFIEAGNNIKNPKHTSHVLWYVERSMHYFQEGAERKIAEGLHPQKVAAYQYYKPQDLIRRKAMYPILKNDVKNAIWFEQNPDKWFNGKDWHPTQEQLMDPNLSPYPLSAQSASIWQGIGLGMDRNWPDIVEFSHMKTGETPTRTPGYMFHVSKGPWKTVLVRSNPDGTRTNVRTLSSSNKAERDRLAQLLDEHKPNDNQHTVVTLDPRINNDMADALHDVMQSHSKTDDPEIEKILMEVYARNALGELSQSMERQEEPQDLYDMHRIVSGDRFEFNEKQAFDALQNYFKLMEHIPVAVMRARFMRDRLFPLAQTGLFTKFPKLGNAVEEYVKAFLHVPETASSHVDNFFTDIAIKMGQDPKLPANITRQLAGWGAKFFLLWSVPFWVVGQAFQSIQAIPDMNVVNSQILQLGMKPPSILKALAQSLIPSQLVKLSTGETLAHYTEVTGHANPQFIENIDKSGFLEDPVAKALDRFTRQQSAVRAYYLFRQVFDEETALNAAMWSTDKDNVPYTRELGKNFLFQKEGEILSPVGLFMQFTLHQFQRVSWQIQTLGKAIGSKEPEAVIHAMIGLGGTMAMFMALAGLRGLPMASNWDTIAEWFNKAFGTTWMTTKELARSVGDLLREHNFGDEGANLFAKWAEFGIPSAQSGYDMSSSGQGPGLQFPEVFLKFLSNLIDVGIVTAKWLSPVGISRETLGQDINQLPRPLRMTAEEALRNRDVVDILKDIWSGRGEQAPNPHDVTLPGDYHRTPMDMIMYLFGVKSTGESAVNTTMQIDTRAQAVEAAQVQSLLQQIKEDPNGSSRAEKLQMLIYKYHQNPETVLEAIDKYQIERQMTETGRRKYEMDPTSLTSIAHMQRWLKENNIAPK